MPDSIFLCYWAFGERRVPSREKHAHFSGGQGCARDQ
jgi:hypothetical protein